MIHTPPPPQPLNVYKLTENDTFEKLVGNIVVVNNIKNDSMDFMGKLISIQNRPNWSYQYGPPPIDGKFDIYGNDLITIPDNLDVDGRTDKKYNIYTAEKVELIDKITYNTGTKYIACWKSPSNETSNKHIHIPKCREIINITKVPGSPFVYIINTKKDGAYRVYVDGTEVDPPRGGKRSKKRRTKRNKKSRHSRRKHRK